MKILEFLQFFEQKPIFSTNDVERVYPNFDRKNLVRWQKKGYILKLRSNWYALPNLIKNEFDQFLLGNSIYCPSYISLESAFAYYQFIPEGVFTTISISTRKTAFFSNEIGHFRYFNLKPSLFFGFHFPENIKMAEPEKAILDYLYLHHEAKTVEDFEGLRWNRAEILAKIDLLKMENYARIFDSAALNSRFATFKKFLHDQY
jgi:predicted transcriptional regulator of viral defense system